MRNNLNCPLSTTGGWRRQEKQLKATMIKVITPTINSHSYGVLHCTCVHFFHARNPTISLALTHNDTILDGLNTKHSIYIFSKKKKETPNLGFSAVIFHSLKCKYFVIKWYPLWESVWCGWCCCSNHIKRHTNFSLTFNHQINLNNNEAEEISNINKNK